MIVLPAGGQQAQYNIEQSVRFRYDTNANFDGIKCYTNNGRTTGTISCCVKLSDARHDNYHYIFEQGGDANNRISLLTRSSADANAYRLHFLLTVSGTNYQLVTTRVFRDPTAWYHIVAVLDTTNATAADRMRLYINGERETDFVTNTVSSIPQNQVTRFNSNWDRTVGSYSYGSGVYTMEGYIADFKIVDNQALTADDFGEYDETYNTWRPKEYTGSYGLNGVHLDFADNSGLGVTQIGKNKAEYTMLSASTDGTKGYYRYSQLSGVSDGSQGTISMWVKFDNASPSSNSGNAWDLVWGSRDNSVGDSVAIYRYSSGAISVRLYDSSFSNILFSNSTSTLTSTTDWYHIYTTWDTVNEYFHVYINGVEETMSSYTFNNNNNVNYTVPYAGFGGDLYSPYQPNTPADWGQIYINYSEYLDPATYLNKFISGGKPVGLGGDGSLPSGNSPTVYLNGAGGTTKTTNVGTGGAFTQSGSVASGSSLTGEGYSEYDFTPSGISLTSGYTYDWMKDVPLPVDEDTGNFFTMHPLWKSSNSTTSFGNLRAQSTGGVNHTQLASHTWQSGKWYIEIYIVNGSDSDMIGIQRYIDFTGTYTDSYRVDTKSAYGAGLYRNGQVYTTSGATNCTASFTTGDTIMMAIEIDNDKVWWGVNGTWGNLGGAGVGDPANGTNPHFTNIVSENDGNMFGLSDASSGSNYDLAINFGQQPYNYTPPAGFKKCNSYNVEGYRVSTGDQEVASGKDTHDIKTWTGNGTSQDITGLKFQPDLVIIKNLSTARYWRLQDSVRGATGTDTMLYTNNSSNAANYSNAITSFNSDGVSLGTDVGVNESGKNFVGYFWKAGEGTTSSNTEGSITSTVSAASEVTGMSIAKYTGNGTAGATIGHGLNSTFSYSPLYMVKNLSTSQNWALAHRVANVTRYIPMPLGARTTDSTIWNNTNMNATVATVGTSALTNTSGDDYILYSFSFDGGRVYYYRGSGTDNGQTFIPLNFKPSMIWIKPRDNTTQWYVWDNGQNNHNPRNTFHYLDLTNTPNTSGADINFLSNGVTIRNTAADLNGSSTIYAFVAFKDTHAKYSLAG